MAFPNFARQPWGQDFLMRSTQLPADAPPPPPDDNLQEFLATIFYEEDTPNNIININVFKIFEDGYGFSEPQSGSLQIDFNLPGADTQDFNILVTLNGSRPAAVSFDAYHSGDGIVQIDFFDSSDDPVVPDCHVSVQITYKTPTP